MTSKIRKNIGNIVVFHHHIAPPKIHPKTRKVCHHSLLRCQSLSHRPFTICRYLACRNDSVECTTEILKQKIPVTCKINEDGKTASWVIDYKEVFKLASPKPSFPPDVRAKCVEGCNSDNDCEEGKECVPVKRRCLSPLGCPLGSCMPHRCPIPSKTLGGRLLHPTYRGVGVSTKFQCRIGYFMPKHGSSELSVKCMPKSDGFPVGSYFEGPSNINGSSRFDILRCRIGSAR